MIINQCMNEWLRWSPIYYDLAYDFSTLRWHENDMHPIETVLWISNSDLFLDK